ncbi:MAG: SurA N-terminal domain-containing protein [gamma proteobacterium symbiont of Bathyaustriella thionipta]|nr:SurA N-terminal domain-containing protein [gamma proteobacterium symbiont of Bathyaustriella thionipta]MCU7949457.1 SurA N-terminal domain-containing protein [gamma proteobacterium symbiont of Bathyaustriella thionipta]MCU7951951.1 SurA N-terminal domain-containing protein [gamma proteobacterium symbiont of Bathyaustriella thionipta]MCU7956044.1 SurA N-terminal domain-containing protein [gamma proteobacterium symbiont of Bathyaustriella thionipta]MCU7965924.1 SurA N-terminal domain-containin
MVLHSIRERATGWFAWVIVILISIPFALWGINSYITSDANPSVANVGDYKVTVQEFQNAVQNESKEFKGQIDDALIKQVVLEKLINNRALINFLSQSGLSISKSQVDSEIRNDANFQLDGQFSEELYNRYLPSAYSKSNYRNSMATQLLLEQFSDGINSSSFVSDNEVKRVIQLIKQKRDISYTVIKAEDFANAVTVTEEEIKNYYQNFQNQFSNPEQIKLAYLEISRKDLAKDVQVTDEQINKYYQDNLPQYTQPERRKASHILFTLPTDADTDTKDKTKEEAQNVLDKINSGSDFSEMAKEHSQDPGSADNGGDLGFFAKGEMVPAFEQSAFSLNPGDISDLVESSFGFHIIKLTSIEGGKSKPLDTVKDKIIESIQFDSVENSYFEKVESMQTIAYEQPDSLEPVAAELNLATKESEFITAAGGSGIFSNTKLLNIAFGETVLEEGNNSDLIELGNDHVAVIRLIERIPANTKPLDEVKTIIETRLKQDSLTDKAQEKATQFITLLTDGTSLEQLSQDNSLIVENSGAIDRQNMNMPGEIMRKAFTMPREMKYATTKMMNGDVAIIAIKSIEDGDSGDQALFDSIKTALLQNKGNMETSLSVLQIRAGSEIVINTQLLNEQE